MKDSFKDLTHEELKVKREELAKEYDEVSFNGIIGHVDNPLDAPVAPPPRARHHAAPRARAGDPQAVGGVTWRRRSRRRTRGLQGRVVSTKMTKTIVIEATVRTLHPLYKKYLTRTKRLKAHDEARCGVGDLVRVVETRPLSRDKRWRLAEIVERAK